jgi:hypothetical protein
VTAPSELPVGGVSTRLPSSAVGRRRRRRPTGAPPPLPKSLGTTGKVWLAGLAALIAWLIVLVLSPTARRLTEQADTAVLQQIARVRTAWLTDVATTIDRIATASRFSSASSWSR